MRNSPRSEATRALDVLGGTINTLEAAAVEDDEAPDVIARVDHLIKRLRNYRTGLLAETPEGMIGQEFQIVRVNRADRTYNDERIIADLAAACDYDPFTALQMALENDAVRLSWRWTDLNRLAANVGLDLTIRKGGDVSPYDGLDEPHVGEIWKSSTKPEPIISEEE